MHTSFKTQVYNTLNKLTCSFSFSLLFFTLFLFLPLSLFSQSTRLLRQPSISAEHIAFAYAGDIWTVNHEGKSLNRITTTAAVESNPHISPDGKMLAFSSDRTGTTAVYLVPIEGGSPKQLSWHPDGAIVRGWTPDGEKILFASRRDFAPGRVNRLWTVSIKGGAPELLSSQWANDGSFSSDGKSIFIDRVRRWDSEWRNYRGGQNTPLIILNLEDQSETLLPNDKTIDIHPLWTASGLYFLSDRSSCMNVWHYNLTDRKLTQVTEFKDSDIKWLDGNQEKLVYERNGLLWMLNPASGQLTQLNIKITGDFPWMEEQWEDAGKSARNVSLSATGKRILLEARGDIYTVPVENGSARNLTASSGVADRRPLWSPLGDSIAWFSDKSTKAYELLIAKQDGLSEARSIPLGESKLAWEATWSPDGNYIAFVDDDVRIRLVNLKTNTIKTIDIGGNNTERGSMGLSWSPDSHWLAYAKTGSNNFRRIWIWSVDEEKSHPITNFLADAFSPVWDMNKKHLYFLASTELALGSGWANTSAMSADPEYSAYLINLNSEDPSPFKLESDEEENQEKANSDHDADTKKEKEKKDKKKNKEEADNTEAEAMTIDFENPARRTIALGVKAGNYLYLIGKQEGAVFLAQREAGSRSITLKKFVLKDKKDSEYISNVSSLSISADGKKLLAKSGGSWTVMDATKPNGKGGEKVDINISTRLNRQEEWRQIFEEAWRYERDYFYDPGLHGRDWEEVYARYAPLVPYIRHRTDLTYLLDQINGELSVGHSFVFGGDYPKTGKHKTGLPGADLVKDQGYWKIKRIFTTESWNPELSSPLDEPGLTIKEGYYLVGIDGRELTADDNPYEFLEGTLRKQTIIHLNSSPAFDGAWKEIIKPIGSEFALRQRAWVEDNRRLVDSLSGGRLAYVWIPNTAGQGLVSFNRYFFAQQDKEGAVIDERFNGGGLLDDYMTDLMTRKMRAAWTNEVPNGKPGILPAGILGPKVLLINEMAGSGGDFFPWVFRQQGAGLLIGTTTWGGLVKSSVHYSLIDGGALTAPDNAIFDPVRGEWIGENKGISPDIEVRQDALSLKAGKDPQLLRAVEEALKLLENSKTEITIPEFPSPAKK